MINSNIIRLSFVFLLFVVCGVLPAFAQNESGFCSSNNWSGGKNGSVSELREMNVSAVKLLTVDGNKNGGIRIKGEDRRDVLVRACVQAWAQNGSDAQARVKNIRVETGSTIRAAGDGSNWSVSYEILVPRQTNLKLSAQNGGIGISNVSGSLNFETDNGGISLSDVAGDVRGRTSNGGVVVNLSGNRWNGSGLNVETTNGGVILSMPENYAARLETSTTNGGFRSDFDLNVQKRQWQHGVNINTDLNGGGAPIRVVTTNGGLKINAVR